MSHLLITGANGFVGQALSCALLDGGHTVTGLLRQRGGALHGVDELVDSSADFADLDTVWPPELRPDCVVHLAARVHVMHDASTDPDAAFRQTNVDGSLRVARAAQRNGVRRFVFVSSVKAMAEIDAGRPLREEDPPAPQDPYGRSKLAAEEALTRYGKETGLEIVIVRPPLVYGPHVRANFLRLMDALWKGMPLPLAAIGARRSLVYVDNLADALVHCATDPRAAYQCFLVADSDAPTVAELARSLGRDLGKPARLLPVPPGWLRAAGLVTGRSAYVDRLIGSLQVDTARIRAELDWRPPFSTEDGLAATARWYRSMH
ncbi:UDP-glucose 4-epimerase family protein [Paraburkholderia domus]|uniref:UDP-glucose 4-epimerase family protein n=1 Tax=Paraburkholderia domus TaxID=2793075 RepID=UPI0019138E75|nr:SDR family oxidoreductase [Paraburkholderia domus]MBK5184312.1 SDR family oxidoreductase [Burkholderia sp. R-69749]CAE6872064.1 N-acetyl-alpha-D-glucosaminyl-diphospho-ditrans, octacis-undecaprenol 4-epimerase [Paraburkholderia domus]